MDYQGNASNHTGGHSEDFLADHQSNCIVYKSLTPPPEDFKLSYVDFLPGLLSGGGLFEHAVFERFDVLVDRANAWLSQHQNIKVQTCESIELKAHYGGQINSEKVTFFESRRSTLFIRALRLWIVPKTREDAASGCGIGYINMVPICIDQGGLFQWPKFESFGQTLERLNQYLKGNPIQGRILTVETQEMKMNMWMGNVDPDKSSWWSSEEHRNAFLYVIRVFYLIGPPAYEEIGCADFLPECVKPATGFFDVSHFESFAQLLTKARHFCQQQSTLHVTNCQSINYKLSSRWSGGSLDTHRSFYSESGSHTTEYVRILRVSYVRPYISSVPEGIYTHSISLHYKTFYPVQLTAGSMWNVPEFETMSQTMTRAAVWLQNAGGVNLVAVETVPVRIYGGNQYGQAEQTYSWNRAERGEYWIFVVRVYLDGAFTEPPAEVLPPVPQVQVPEETGCCSIS